MRGARSLGWTLAAMLAWMGCGSMGTPSMSAGGGGGGARAGGAQDISLARSKVAGGMVPTPNDFAPEGVYSESDVPLEGSPCQELFCVRAGAARAPDVTAEGTAGYVHLGLASNVDVASFHRGPLNVALVIDTSCSMTGEKIDAIRLAASTLVDKLGEQDVLTLVRFNERSSIELGPEPVTDRERFKAAIGRLQADGSTCIECGLRDGFSSVAKNSSSARSDRVFLFTDALPNVGATGEGEFSRLLRDNAERGIGASIFGVGLDFGQELVTQISAVRGANYVYLDTTEHMSAVFDQDFDFLVTPIAYDLKLALTPAAGVALAGFYGAPGQESSTSPEVSVKTVFLSRTHGALVARLSGAAAEAPLLSLQLSYSTPGGEQHQAQLDAVAPAGDPPAYSGAGAHKAVVLTRFVVGARKACELYHGGQATEARAESARVAQFMADEATALSGDADVAREAKLAEDLAALLATK